MLDYRDIVVDACPRDHLPRTLAYARDLARTIGARVSAVSYAWPRRAIKDVLVRSTVPDQEQVALMKRALAASRGAFDQVFAGGSAEADWHSSIGDPNVEMQAHLLAADLLITDSTGEGACVLANPARIALECGIPVLRLGRLPPAGLSSVVVGWKDTAQARRAVHDALPILVRADSVLVVGVGDEVAMQRLDAVVAHLRRHAIKARPWHVPDTAGDAASSLIEQARRESAELIVTGAFSRGPWAQRVLGGVTASMLGSAEIAWLTAH
jgi:nucleotide-binding universal stress UspA family protein